MPLVARTATGLRLVDWLVRLMSTLENLGITQEKLFQGREGELVKIGQYSENFYLCLEFVQSTKPELIQPTVEIREEYGISRSLRQVVTTHAQNMKVPEHVVEANNQWRKEESTRGGKPRLTMSEYVRMCKSVCGRLTMSVSTDSCLHRQA